MAEQEFTAEELESEEWRDVSGYEGFYQISSLGRIRSLISTPRYRETPRILRTALVGSGYPGLRLSRNPVDKKMAFIHRLVLVAFQGPPPTADHQVNHIDGNKFNNRPCNLEWVTHLDNMAHAFRSGLIPLGASRSYSKLTPDNVREIRRLLASGDGAQNIARKFGINESSVREIKSGRIWKHVQ